MSWISNIFIVIIVSIQYTTTPAVCTIQEKETIFGWQLVCESGDSFLMSFTRRTLLYPSSVFNFFIMHAFFEERRWVVVLFICYMLHKRFPLSSDIFSLILSFVKTTRSCERFLRLDLA